MFSRYTLPTAVILVAASLVPNVTLAQSSDKVSLEQLIESAIAVDPILSLERSALEEAKITASNLPWWGTPEMRLGYGRDAKVSDLNRSSTYPDQDYEVSLRVFPKSPWQRRAQIKKLQASGQLQEQSVKVAESAISHAVATRYWDACQNATRLKLSSQLEAIYSQQLDGMQALLESGQTTLGQSLSIKMKLLDLQLKNQSLQQTQTEHLSYLGALSNADAATIQLTELDHLQAGAFNFEYSSWLDTAVAGRTEIAQSKLLTESAKADLEAVKLQRVPWIKHIQADYQIENQYGDQDSMGVQIAFDLPFFSSDGGEKLIATNKVKAYRQNEQLERQILSQEVKALIDQFKALQGQWQQQGRQIESMRSELADAISRMESQGNQGNRNYWDARIANLELSLRQLDLDYTYKKLWLHATKVLGQAPK
ncbi:MAG: TolC family protein [Opitutaceae bacterium]